jgi:hypothetical protein
MKKVLFLAIVSSILLSGCSAPMFALGTSENEFLREARKFRNKSIRIESSNSDLVIYKYGYENSGGVTFYYFRNGKLIETNTGVLAPNVRIEQNIYKH